MRAAVLDQQGEEPPSGDEPPKGQMCHHVSHQGPLWLKWLPAQQNT